MKRKTFVTILMAGLLCFSLAMPLFAAEIDSGGNLYALDNSISVSDLPFVDAWVMGQSVSVDNSKAEGSLGMLGQTVTVAGCPIDGNIYAGGENLVLKDATVMGNVYAAGNRVTVSGEMICNGAYMIGNNVAFEGRTNVLNVAGRKVAISGVINGDANIRADKIEIAPGTIVTGNLTIYSHQEPGIPETAQINNYNFKKVEKSDQSEENAKSVSPLQKKVTSTIYWIAATAALAMIICWLFDKHVARAAQYLETRPAIFAGVGAGGFFLTPLAAILLCCTFILAPAGILLLIIYGILLFCGTAFAGASIPRLIKPDMNIYLSALIGVVILQILRALPVIGTIVGILAGMYLLGYTIQTTWKNRLRRSQSTD